MVKQSVIIIGGGIVGSATAYFLARSGECGSITVIEPDPTYEHASTPNAAGGVRQQFSVPENIEMSTYSLKFYRAFDKHMSDIPDAPDISFREQGYLLVVTENGAETLRSNQERQCAMGVNAHLMDRDETRRQFPSIMRDDIALSCHTPDDGWIDPYAALQGFKRAAMNFGVTYVKSRVSSTICDMNKVTAVALENGEAIYGDMFINTAGPWANEIAKMTGDALPVVPMCRVQHFWKCPHEFEELPLVKDENGMFFRPEGDGFAGGRPSFDIKPGFVEDMHSGFFANYFEETIWPMMASLVPKFEEIRLERTWGGHYAQNLLDGNMIIGPYSTQFENIITACGFSGHGIMHAPAVGNALSELVLHGRFETMDLSRFGIERVRSNSPLAESGIK